MQIRQHRVQGMGGCDRAGHRQQHRHPQQTKHRRELRHAPVAAGLRVAQHLDDTEQGHEAHAVMHPMFGNEQR